MGLWLRLAPIPHKAIDRVRLAQLGIIEWS